MDLPPPPWIVAHRGASGERLENTLDSCLRAVELGAPMLEVDVQLAGDGELVVIHDWDLERLGAGRGVVVELGAEEIVARELVLAARPYGGATATAGATRGAGDPGTNEPPGSAAEAITAGGSAALAPLRGVAPRLSALLAALPAGYPVNLELKRRRADRARFAAAFAAAVGARPNVLVSSFDHELLAAVALAAPALALAPLEAHDAAGLLAAGERLGAWGLHAHRRLATADLAAAARAAGRHLLVYTVNEPATARELFALGVAGVFSDWPAQLLAAQRSGELGGAAG